MSKVYQIVTDRITAALEAGTIPWRKTWSSAGLPTNLLSGIRYRGCNAFLLSLMPYDQPYWLTYKQAQAMGGQVRRGEKSTPVVFWSEFEPKDKRGEDAKKHFVLRYYSAFNVAQCDGLEDKIPEATEPPKPFETIETCAAIVSGYVGPTIRTEGHQPVYNPRLDIVSMPKGESFDDSAAYYATLFHELAHSTGHQSRLNRDGITDPVKFGSQKYGREELVAEMGAAFLCAESGIDAPTLDNTAAYIASWLRTIRQDVRLVASAAAQAQKAADLILDRLRAKAAAALTAEAGDAQ